MVNTSLSNLVSRLINVIGQEAAVFECTLRIIKDQQHKKAITDADGQSRLTALHRVKLVESRILNKKREKLISKIKSLNAIEGDLNISRLLTLVDEDHGNRLAELGDLISGLSVKISEIRDQNTQLLNRTKENISKTLEFLSTISTEQRVADGTGKLKDIGYLMKS